MPDQRDDLHFRTFDGEPDDPREVAGSHPAGLISRRTALLGLGATGMLAGLSVATAAPAEAAANPAPSECRQLITVTTGSSRATTGKLACWTRGSDGGWRRTIAPISCHVGSLGVGKASEGSNITPAGTFPLNVAFGRQADPGTAMPYFRTDPLDWWDENPTSPTYNLHVRQSASPGGNSENLYYSGAVYDYAVNINHNPQRVPYAGSAIFLHVTDGGPTAGCVSVERASLVTILRWLRPDYHPYASIRIGSAWAPTSIPRAQGSKFVTAVFSGVLGRAPRSGELASGVDALYHGASHGFLAYQLAHSGEKYRRVVTQAYRRVLHREPDRTMLEAKAHALATGGRFETLYAGLAASGEAWDKAGHNPSSWIKRTCESLLGRPARDPAPWVARARSDGLAATARQLTATAGFTDHQLDLVYREMLGRNASAAAHRTYGPSTRSRGVFDMPSRLAAGPEFWTRSQG